MKAGRGGREERTHRYIARADGRQVLREHQRARLRSIHGCEGRSEHNKHTAGTDGVVGRKKSYSSRLVHFYGNENRVIEKNFPIFVRREVGGVWLALPAGGPVALP